MRNGSCITRREGMARLRHRAAGVRQREFCHAPSAFRPSTRVRVEMAVRRRKQTIATRSTRYTPQSAGSWQSEQPANAKNRPPQRRGGRYKFNCGFGVRGEAFRLSAINDQRRAQPPTRDEADPSPPSAKPAAGLGMTDWGWMSRRGCGGTRPRQQRNSIRVRSRCCRMRAIWGGQIGNAG